MMSGLHTVQHGKVVNEEFFYTMEWPATQLGHRTP